MLVPCNFHDKMGTNNNSAVMFSFLKRCEMRYQRMRGMGRGMRGIRVVGGKNGEGCGVLSYARRTTTHAPQEVSTRPLPSHPLTPLCNHVHHFPSIPLYTPLFINCHHASPRSTSQHLAALRSTTQPHAASRSPTQHHAAPRSTTQHHAAP